MSKKPAPDVNSRSIEEIINPPEKREEILNDLIKVFKKWNTINLSNDSNVSNSVMKKWIKVNHVSVGQ